jgi:hypothetical protein
MKARDLIGGAAYDPSTLKIITKAFDAAWSEIAHHFERDALHVQSARLKLADAILSVAKEDSQDAEDLKTAALQIMAREYRHPSCKI